EARVAQAACGKFIEVWRRHAAAESAELPEARVVKEDQQDIRGTSGRADNLRKGGRIGVLVCPTYLSLVMIVWTRQRLSRLRRRNRGCHRWAAVLHLSQNGTRTGQNQQNCNKAKST